MAANVSALALVYAVECAELLCAEPAVLRRRTRPDRWSPIEYACHLRDVMLVQRERVLVARRVDRPVAEPMGRDERAGHDGYNEQSPADVARQVQDATAMFANVLDRLTPPDWDRTLTVPYPEESEQSLRWLAVHTVHEMRHHVRDMRCQLERR